MNIKPYYILPLIFFFCTKLSGIDNRSPDDLAQLSLEELMDIKISVASLIEEDELNVGSSAHKVTESEWRKQGATKTFEAIEGLPGIYVNDYFHGIMIPGFRGFNGITQHNSFLMMLDGIPLSNYSFSTGAYGTPNFALGNLESIEVINGPGSALYGSGAMNGVVSLNTWTSNKDTVETWAETGSFGYRQANLRLKETFNSGVSLTSAVSSSGIEDEGIKDKYHDSLTSGNPERRANFTGEYDNLTTSHKLAVKNLELAYYYSRNDAQDSYGTDQLSSFPNGNRSNGLAEMYAVKLSHTQELKKDWELDTSVYHVHDQLFGSFGLNAGAPPTGTTVDWDSEDLRTGIQSVAKKKFGCSDTQLVFGANYDNLEVDHLGLGLTGTPNFVQDRDRQLAGVFGQVERRFWNDKIQTILGARLDDYSDFGAYASPRGALIYHPTKDSALKFLYGNAYRAPSANEQFDNDIIRGGGNSLDPEKVDTYEVIWMRKIDNFSYSTSTYYSEMKDTIDFRPGTLQYENGGKSRSYGVEFNGRVKVDRLQFYGNYSINDAEVVTPTKSKSKYSSYPDQIINLGTQYQPVDRLTFALNNTLQRGRENLYIGAPSHIDHGPLPILWRTDFYTGWKPQIKNGDYELYMNIRDLLNREDMRTSMTPVEAGRDTAGIRFVFGIKAAF
jgi:outer membrane receptor protein involved in Fe transport